MKRQAFEGFTEAQLMAGLFWGEARMWEADKTEEMREYIAIGQVVMNRVKSKGYPDTIHDVILQPGQFSCFNEDDPNNDKIWMFLKNQSPAAIYYTMLTVATGVIAGLYENKIADAKNYVATWFYKTTKGSDHWCQKMFDIARYGGHTFLTDYKQ